MLLLMLPFITIPRCFMLANLAKVTSLDCPSFQKFECEVNLTCVNSGQLGTRGPCQIWMSGNFLIRSNMEILSRWIRWSDGQVIFLIRKTRNVPNPVKNIKYIILPFFHFLHPLPSSPPARIICRNESTKAVWIIVLTSAVLAHSFWSYFAQINIIIIKGDLFFVKKNC